MNHITMQTQSRRVAAFAAVLLAALALSCREEPTTVTVVTVPEGATVWVDGELHGPAPRTVQIPSEGPLALRVAMPPYQDWVAEIPPDKLIAGKSYRVQLGRAETVTVRFESTPPNAEVFVDGERRGTAPLQLTGMAPGPHEALFEMPGRRAAEMVFELEAGRGVQVVRASLEDRTEEAYRSRIAADPDDLGALADLAHHFMVQHRFADAMETFRQGIVRYIQNPALDIKRFKSELQRVPQRQYDYGSPRDVRRACELMKRMLTGVLDDHPKAPAAIYQFHIQLLLQLGDRSGAEQAILDALHVHPNDNRLRRYARNLNID